MTMLRWLSLLLTTLWLAACGGGQVEAPPRERPLAETTPTTLTVHYRRSDGNYDGWQIHTWNAAVDPGWNNGHNATRIDSFGAVYEVPLAAQSGTVGYLFHKGDSKDHGNADQAYVLKPGRNEVWRLQGDNTTYTSNPLEQPGIDITTLRVRYLRPGNDFAAWGLHLWPGSGLDSTRLPAGIVIDNWQQAVGFEQMPGYSAAAGEVVFDIPVLNPRQDATRSALEFIIHGKAPFADNKDGRPDNIRVPFASLQVNNQVGEVWIVQGDSTVYFSRPDTRRVSADDARAYWLNAQLLQWPGQARGGVVKLYHAAAGGIVVERDAPVRGADGAITLEDSTAPLDPALAERWRFVATGARYAVPLAERSRLAELLQQQLVLVQEDGAGRVQNATTAQLPGALDDLYAAAEQVDDLGVRIEGGQTHFKLWAPTAQQVQLIVHGRRWPLPMRVWPMSRDPRTGVWSASQAGDLSGRTYLYAVTVYVRGVGRVTNIVTDPYAISLNADSGRGWIGDLRSPALKPSGWDGSAIPARVQASPDMSIYELHVRDFSIGDASVSTAHRGKYLAFTEAGSRGMQHLKALADAGLTDVHLLPVFDIASVPEVDCSTPAVPAAAPDAEAQQAAVTASASRDCFNWGYDPWHFNAPEGSYASDAADGARRIVEFRRMVMALHAAGLRVGMDVVYNHTTASGQNAKSVLDRIVPGYYHRLNSAGQVEMSTCCDNTATEHRMMAKLMSDSVLLWAREYKIASFRFDIMGHQPRSVMESMQARLRRELGREVQFIGEGWNFGEVADGARFVQASMWSLNGSGIGTFSPFARDAARGGSPFDSGADLLANQGYINGLFYDPNPQGTAKTRADLLWQADLIRAGLAGSIRSYPMQTASGAVQRLEQLNTAGYVLEPSEVVNYVENHDNQTLFDINAFKLPPDTSREDRARVQILGAAITMFSQGVPYFHAGVDTLRSKNLDRNSYDAGDWFNRIDWSYQDNFFGTGLPRAGDNSQNWAVMRPLLAHPLIKPTPTEIAWTRDAFRDLLRIRASTTLLRLRTADDIRQRLALLNTGPTQVPTVLAAAISGEGYAGANFRELLYFINVDKVAQSIDVPAAAGRHLVLHPVHRGAAAADRRVLQARFDAASGRFTIPPRTAVVFVRE